MIFLLDSKFRGPEAENFISGILTYLLILELYRTTVLVRFIILRLEFSAIMAKNCNTFIPTVGKFISK